jgi:predicted RNA-binding Zn ribbon-like protein
METRVAPFEMNVVGGNLALDFVNTRTFGADGQPNVESLSSFDDIVEWARHVDLVHDNEARRMRQRARRDPEVARRAFEHALDVRDRLDRLFRAIAIGRPVPRTLLDQLRSDEAAAIGAATLEPVRAGYAWSWAGGDDLERPVWEVVHAATALLGGNQLGRLKRCGGCTYLFVDESKNRSRRWCSMADCGTAAKSRTYVARRAAARAG